MFVCLSYFFIVQSTFSYDYYFLLYPSPSHYSFVSTWQLLLILQQRNARPPGQKLCRSQRVLRSRRAPIVNSDPEPTKEVEEFVEEEGNNDDDYDGLEEEIEEVGDFVVSKPSAKFKAKPATKEKAVAKRSSSAIPNTITRAPQTSSVYSISPLATPMTPSKPKPLPFVATPFRQRRIPEKSRRAKPADLLAAIGDTVGSAFLINALDENDYGRRASFYHVRLALLIRGLNNNELTRFFRTATPGFYSRLDKQEQDALRSRFNKAYDQVEYYIMQMATKLAHSWLESDAGKAYKIALVASM